MKFSYDCVGSAVPSAEWHRPITGKSLTTIRISHAFSCDTASAISHCNASRLIAACFSNLDSFDHLKPLGPSPIRVHRSTSYGWVPRFCSNRALPFSVRQYGIKANESPVCRTGASIVTIFISRSDAVLPVIPRMAVG
jgi:hypothetical protein